MHLCPGVCPHDVAATLQKFGMITQKKSEALFSDSNQPIELKYDHFNNTKVLLSMLFNLRFNIKRKRRLVKEYLEKKEVFVKSGKVRPTVVPEDLRWSPIDPNNSGTSTLPSTNAVSFKPMILATKFSLSYVVAT